MPTVAQPDPETEETTRRSESDAEDSEPSPEDDAEDDADDKPADDKPSGDARPAESNPEGGGRESATDRATDSLPEDPKKRLKMAESAFNNGDFSRLPALLRPLLEPKPVFRSAGDRIRARELLGVGLYFAAQSATDPDKRDQLLATARRQFLELLRERPDYELDPLIFPASVVELFENVRREHAEELEQIRRDRQTDNGGAARTLYIERSVERRLFAVNFLPFGLGQFQNDEPIKGALFAGGQGLALAAHTAGFVVVESLRNSETGLFATDGAYQTAGAWRVVQWSAVGTFAGLWLWSMIDALVQYQPTDVHIRTLDNPPPELQQRTPSEPSSKLVPKLRIGFGTVRVRW